MKLSPVISVQLAVLLVIVSTALPAVEFKGNTLVLSPDEIALCGRQGGCALFTLWEINRMTHEARKEGRAECRPMT